MKKITTLLILFVTVSSSFGANVISVVNTSVNAGAEFEVEIAIANDDLFNSFQFDVNFPSGFTFNDEAVLSSRSVGHELSYNGLPVEDPTYVRLLSWSNSSLNFSGYSGTIVTLTFQASSTPGGYTFSITNETMGSGSGNLTCSTSSGTITVNEVPAPIELSSFLAVMTSTGVRLSWVTASETENSHFLIYRDGEVIAQVDGAGTTTEQHRYTFLDTRVQGGMHSYAISDVSYGGIEELHDALVVEVGEDLIEADFEMSKIYPNPFNPSVTINFQLSTFNKVSAFIYNTHGNMIKELLNDEMNAGSHTLTWNAEGMPSGTYIVKMMAGDVMQTQKIVLMK